MPNLTDPKLRELVERMHTKSEELAPIIKGHMPNNFGFTLFLIHLGDPGLVKYIANIDRGKVLRAISAWLMQQLTTGPDSEDAAAARENMQGAGIELPADAQLSEIEYGATSAQILKQMSYLTEPWIRRKAHPREMALMGMLQSQLVETVKLETIEELTSVREKKRKNGTVH